MFVMIDIIEYILILHQDRINHDIFYVPLKYQKKVDEENKIYRNLLERFSFRHL
jgi:hypothetical protein